MLFYVISFFLWKFTPSLICRTVYTKLSPPFYSQKGIISLPGIMDVCERVRESAHPVQARCTALRVIITCT